MMYRVLLVIRLKAVLRINKKSVSYLIRDKKHFVHVYYLLNRETISFNR